MQCPKCGSTDHIPVDGGFLCLDCRNEFTANESAAVVPAPAATSFFGDAPTDDVAAAKAATTVDGVLSVGDSNGAELNAPHVGDTPDTPPNLAGRFVRERNSDAFYLCVEDDGEATVRLADSEGETFDVMRSDIVAVDSTEPHPLAPTVGADTVSEDQPFDPAIFVTASLALTMGLQCVGDDGETLYNPRIGWLPPPCNEVPEVEQGVAYAIAVLVTTFKLDRGNVEAIAATLMQGAATPGEEVTE